MDWYYALNGQQAGPVTETQLDELLRAGTINATTLVWREGLAEWQPLQTLRAVAPPPGGSPQPFSAMPGSPAAGPGAGPGTGPSAQCAECHRAFPQSEMVFLNRSWVCASCKPIFVQRMKEGAAPAGGQLWRFGKQLVLRPGTPLPDRCVKCNAPVHGSRLTRRLYWHPPAIYLLILINLLIYIVVAIIVRKRAVIEIGLCQAHRQRRMMAIASAWLSVLVGIALFAAGISNDSGSAILVGLLLFLTGCVVGAVLAPQVAAAKIDKEFAWVRGCCHEYLAQLPEWNGPS